MLFATDSAWSLPHAEDSVWNGQTILWKQPATWAPTLTAWLGPYVRADAEHQLRPSVHRDLSWDDSAWLDVLGCCLESGVEELALALSTALLSASVRTYHGCCTDDAGSYFRDGVLTHNRQKLTERALAIIQAHREIDYLASGLDRKIAALSHEGDEGKLFVTLDDCAMLEHSAHYLIYGSEYIIGLFDKSGRRVLQQLGVPTFIEINLPFAMVDQRHREHFARILLREWTRMACNGVEWSAPVDFSFVLHCDLPAELVVGHTHPAEMKNPLDGMRTYRPLKTSCNFCK